MYLACLAPEGQQSLDIWMVYSTEPCIVITSLKSWTPLFHVTVSLLTTHIPASIAIDGRRLTDRVYKKNCMVPLTVKVCYSHLSTISSRDSWTATCTTFGIAQMMGLGRKWQWAVGNSHEICAVLINAALIVWKSNKINNVLLFTRVTLPSQWHQVWLKVNVSLPYLLWSYTCG